MSRRLLSTWSLLAISAVLAGLSGQPSSAATTDEAELWENAGVTRLAHPTAAPTFALSDLAGMPVDLKDLRGRLVMLYFWATW